MKFILWLLVFLHTPYAQTYSEFLINTYYSNSVKLPELKSQTTPQLTPQKKSGLAKQATKVTGMTLSNRFHVDGPNAPAEFMAVSGGDLYIAGLFTAIGAKSMPGLAKWDGQKWEGLANDFDQPVAAMTIFQDRIYAGGFFTKTGNSQIEYLAQWDGSSWTSVGTMASPRPVLAMARYGQDLFVGMSPESSPGMGGVARWNGSEWSSLGNTNQARNTGIYAMKATEKGLVVGGEFTHLNGVPVEGVALWTGTEWQSVGGGLRGSVKKLEYLDGNLYAAGSFRLASDTARCTVARWDGVNWTRVLVDPSLPTAQPEFFASMIVDEKSGRLYLCGEFPINGGTSELRVYQLDEGGWSNMGPAFKGLYYPGSLKFGGLAVFNDQVYASGSFSRNDDAGVQGLAVWDGVKWTQWPEGPGLGMGGAVATLAPWGRGFVAGGGFTSAGSIPVNGLSLFDGNSWTDMGFPEPAWGGGRDAFSAGSVSTISSSGDVLYAGLTPGDFGLPARVYRMEANQWKMIGEPKRHELVTYISEVFSQDGGVYVSGGFDSIGGVAARNIAYWNGQEWSPLGAGLNGPCAALEWFDGYLYAGGIFDTAGGLQANHIARWDGREWSVLGTADSNGVKATGDASVLAIRKQGNRIVVGGTFGSAGGIPTRNIATWSAQGWKGGWTSYRNGIVKSIAVKDDSVLFIAHERGMWDLVNGNVGVAMWNGKDWIPLDGGFQWPNSTILDGGATIASLLLTDNMLVAGGMFLGVGNVPSNYIAQWSISDGTSVRKPAVVKRFSGLQLLVNSRDSQSDMMRMAKGNPGTRFYDARGRLRSLAQP